MRKARPHSEIIHRTDQEFICSAEKCNWRVYTGGDRWSFEEKPEASYCSRACAEAHAPEVLSPKERRRHSVASWLKYSGYEPVNRGGDLFFRVPGTNLAMTAGALYVEHEETLHVLGARNLEEAVDLIREATREELGHRCRRPHERGPNIHVQTGSSYPVEIISVA